MANSVSRVIGEAVRCSGGAQLGSALYAHMRAVRSCQHVVDRGSWKQPSLLRRMQAVLEQSRHRVLARLVAGWARRALRALGAGQAAAMANLLIRSGQLEIGFLRVAQVLSFQAASHCLRALHTWGAATVTEKLLRSLEGQCLDDLVLQSQSQQRSNRLVLRLLFMHTIRIRCVLRTARCVQGWLSNLDLFNLRKAGSKIQNCAMEALAEGTEMFGESMRTAERELGAARVALVLASGESQHQALGRGLEVWRRMVVGRKAREHLCAAAVFTFRRVAAHRIQVRVMCGLYNWHSGMVGWQRKSLQLAMLGSQQLYVLVRLLLACTRANSNAYISHAIVRWQERSFCGS
eukprot:TRINITY_DN24416_c0_g2_i3.p1 TRINITY_DN24416_c0_g2~~TRINITY_DN24416_c0_g2_i3.p1  ORF type:complete len:348 (-),score=43.43 TRINITY_DN24416_c0_g2_i3:30-1073(-)